MPSFNIYQSDGTAGVALTGSSLGTIIPTDLVPPAVFRVLYDDDDATYWQILGGVGTDQSMVTDFHTTQPDSEVNPSVVLPINTTVLTVTFAIRIKNSDTGCAASGLNSFAEVWRVFSGTEEQFTTVELPSHFTDMDVSLPTRPSGGGDVPWTPAALYTFPYQYGLRCRTDCFTSLAPTQMGVDWAEGHIRVDFTLPTPTLALNAADAITPRGATVSGTINPNQTFIGFPTDYTQYPIEYGFTIGSIQGNLPPIVYYGTVTGTTAPITVSHVYNNLSPNITWYYKMAARDVDGNVFESSVASFTTPITDAIRGVY